MKKFFHFTLCSLFFALAFFQLSASADDVNVGADIKQGASIGVSGGRNQFGMLTFLNGSTIDFGTISFSHPEAVNTGDAYLKSGMLQLEAILDVELIFNSANSATINISHIQVSTNPFHKSYYSLSTNRNASSTAILDEPQKSLIKRITAPEKFPLRLTFEVSPQQAGKIRDRFSIEARIDS